MFRASVTLKRTIATRTETALVDAYLLSHPSPTCARARLKLHVRLSSRRAMVCRDGGNNYERPLNTASLALNEPVELNVDTSVRDSCFPQCTSASELFFPSDRCCPPALGFFQ